VDVDGSKAFLTLEISVRWPASVPVVTEQVRSHLRRRVNDLTGLSVEEVHIVVASSQRRRGISPDNAASHSRSAGW
jgi:uncharacterized alkaline shock family protein YloU